MASRHVGEDGPVGTKGPGLEGMLVASEGLQDGVIIRFEAVRDEAAAGRQPGCRAPSR